jgi:hypothetical protein
LGYLLAGAEAQAGHERLPTADRMEVGVSADKSKRLQGVVEHRDPRVQLRFPGTRQPPLPLGLVPQRPAHVNYGGAPRGHGRRRWLGVSLTSRAQASEPPPLVRAERDEHEYVRRV